MTSKLYFPFIAQPLRKRGIGLCDGNTQDVAALNCAWYYNWSSTPTVDARFVPMSWGGAISSQTSGYLLFLNEPDNPNQSNITPDQARVKFEALKQARPNLQIIAGGCTAIMGRAWLQAFAAYKLPVAGYHFHGYIEPGLTWDNARDFWQWCTDTLAGELWVTEFADITAVQTMMMAKWLQDNPQITRYAAFTNRAYPDVPGAYPANWPRPPVLNMIDSAGGLTALGAQYKVL